jgi:branched-chain amino acid transport system substrate-binding protein
MRPVEPCGLGLSAAAQKQYGPGASDIEIRIGNIMPYSGPLSAYALIGRTQTAFFRMINEQGGINGRKINFITYDDAFSPPKTVEQARKLVESDEVLLTFQSLGTSTNNAIQKYLDQKRVPQLFVATGATKFGDPKNFPVDYGLAADLPDRRAHPRQTHLGESAAGRDRRPLSER